MWNVFNHPRSSVQDVKESEIFSPFFFSLPICEQARLSVYETPPSRPMNEHPPTLHRPLNYSCSDWSLSPYVCLRKRSDRYGFCARMHCSDALCWPIMATLVFLVTTEEKSASSVFYTFTFFVFFTHLSHFCLCWMRQSSFLFKKSHEQSKFFLHQTKNYIFGNKVTATDAKGSN